VRAGLAVTEALRQGEPVALSERAADDDILGERDEETQLLEVREPIGERDWDAQALLVPVRAGLAVTEALRRGEPVALSDRAADEDILGERDEDTQLLEVREPIGERDWDATALADNVAPGERDTEVQPLAVRVPGPTPVGVAHAETEPLPV
jgi:hypothetical protein